MQDELKQAELFDNNDWYCPYCNELNNTELPEKIIQCTWCEKELQHSNKIVSLADEYKYNEFLETL